ncbi:hypothetical protein PIB30_039578 [Stylosanthes scabra]|uniref:Uncharacterized protein n=1 Tax=Stylosanthes scabra TaxID=79078 RepID=A0ABU6WCQ9_9FABA|nr:hypothetical protein [Stylosanthes scabra]
MESHTIGFIFPLLGFKPGCGYLEGHMMCHSTKPPTTSHPSLPNSHDYRTGNNSSLSRKAWLNWLCHWPCNEWTRFNPMHHSLPNSHDYRTGNNARKAWLNWLCHWPCNKWTRFNPMHLKKFFRPNQNTNSMLDETILGKFRRTYCKIMPSDLMYDINEFERKKLREKKLCTPSPKVNME